MKNQLRLAALLGAMAMVGSIVTVTATHVEPVITPGNPTCSDVAPEGTTWTEFKIDPGMSGTFDDGTLNVSIMVHENEESGPTFDWESNITVGAVLSKGGPLGANLYLYGAGAMEDTGLHSPLNPSGKWAGLSHITFCYEEPEALSEETCEENSDQEVCQPSEETCEQNPDQEQCQPHEEVCPIDSLAASANDDGSITVSGSASGEFDLYRMDGGEEAVLIGTFDGDFEYHDTDTVSGTTYTYTAMDGQETCARVEVTAIPVFPTVAAAVAAVGLSGLGYAMLRRRT